MNQENRENIRVLYVDDEEGNLKAFRSTFRREFEVLTAGSGAEALNLLERETVHVVISDQRMPGMSGAEFLACVSQRWPEVMRMMLTGYADIEAVIDAVNRGRIYAYATKPWDPNDLRLRIQQAHEVHALRSERERLYRRYRQVFEASADPIAIIDGGARLRDANPSCLRLLGLAEVPAEGFVLTALVPDATDLRKALQGKRKGRDFVNVDLGLTLPDGRAVDCLLTATYLGRDAQHGRLFQVMIRDITDRKQEEERLRRLNKDLDRRVAARTRQLLDALEDLGSFSYTVAHDLRSPLKNIHALTTHLQEQGETDGQSEEAELALRIRKGTERMLELVDDLLRFSQTNTREMVREQVHLDHLVTEVLDEQAPTSTGIARTLVDLEGITLSGDRAMLKVMLNNLISNAVKFTRSMDHPHIEVGHALLDDGHHIWVKDNGVGFDGSRSEQVFAAFKRLHRTDQFEGSGVGLAIVSRIVGKHGGRTWAESSVGKGTCMHIWLPREAPAHLGLPFEKVA